MQKNQETVFCVPAHALSEMRYVPKVSKYIAVIQFHGHPQQEFWVSEKQAKNISEVFPEEGYSTKNDEVYTVLALRDGQLRFIWAALNEPNARDTAAHFKAAWGWPEDKCKSDAGDVEQSRVAENG